MEPNDDEWALFDHPRVLSAEDRERFAPLKQRRRIEIPDHRIRTEAELIDLLKTNVYHVRDIQQAVIDAGIAGRDNGYGKRTTGDEIFRHRTRSGVDTRRRSSRAFRMGDGYWLIEGKRKRPAKAVFMVMGKTPDIGLILGAARDVARQIQGPVDLIFCDPPWQLDVGRGRDGGPLADQYGRPRSLIVPGYQEVPSGMDYYDFSYEWIEEAAGLLRTGGHMAVMTNAENSAYVQLAGKKAGLHYTNKLIVPLATGVQPTKHRYAKSHNEITVMAAGRPSSAQRRSVAERTFNLHADMHRDKLGRPFPRRAGPDCPQRQSRAS